MDLGLKKKINRGGRGGRNMDVDDFELKGEVLKLTNVCIILGQEMKECDVGDIVDRNIPFIT